METFHERLLERMKLKDILMSVTATLIFSGCTVENQIHDFYAVCDYFEELELAISSTAMDHEQHNNFIMDRILANLPETSNARVAWEAISAADSTERYDLFKYAADSIQDTNWKCEPMKELAGSAGVFE